MSLDYAFGALTCDQIYDDVVFFLRQSKEAAPSQRKRYARATIIFTAFFFESMANLLVDRTSDKDSSERSTKHGRRPSPLQKFRSIFQKVKGKPMELDTRGIQDLFTIRNRVFGHPEAWFVYEGSQVPQGKGLTQDRKPLPFLKFKDFPNIYTEFDSVHAEVLLAEVKDFLHRYSGLVKDQFPGSLRQFQTSYLHFLEHKDKFK